MHLINKYSVLILFSFLICQKHINVDDQINHGIQLYNKGDYNNAIIIFEDVLAEQELLFGNNNVKVAKTLSVLGELYSLSDMPDISYYYFQEAIKINENYFLTQKDSLKLPLLQLMKIYSFTNDTLMKQNVENRLYSISSILETIGSDENLSSIGNNVLPFEEDYAIDLMDKGLSYVNNGLYSEAAINFSNAFDYQTENLSLNFLNSFFPSDSIFRKNMINAFSFQVEKDTTGTPYFFQALLYQSGELAYHNIIKYIEYEPLEIRGRLFYSNLYFNDEIWIDALIQYRHALWLDSLNIDALMGSALTLFYLNKYEDAIYQFDKILKLDPYKHDAFYYLGLSHATKNNYALSINNFTQSLLLDPNNSNIYYNLGRAYYENGQIVQAREAFTRAINLEPTYGKAYYYQGIINESIMEIDYAIELYRKALQFSPNIEDLYYRLGMLLYRTNNIKEAMEPLRQFIIYKPDSLNVLKTLGKIFIIENRYSEAIDTYKRLQIFYPEDIEININLADSYYQLGDFFKAKNAYEKILLFDDENYNVMYQLGKIYSNLKNYNKAEIIYNEIIKCAPPQMETYYQLAMILGEQKKICLQSWLLPKH